MLSRFWMLGSGTMVAAACAGLLLGGYVTTQPRSALAGDSADYAKMFEAGDEADVDAAATGDLGLSMAPTEPVVCKGCGPTLSDRRFAADMAGLDADGYVTGSTDAIVRDYLADEPLPPPADLLGPIEPRPAPAARVAPLPPAVVRIARGGQAESVEVLPPAGMAATVQVAAMQ